MGNLVLAAFENPEAGVATLRQEALGFVRAFDEYAYPAHYGSMFNSREIAAARVADIVLRRTFSSFVPRQSSDLLNQAAFTENITDGEETIYFDNATLAYLHESVFPAAEKRDVLLVASKTAVNGIAGYILDNEQLSTDTDALSSPFLFRFTFESQPA